MEWKPIDSAPKDGTVVIVPGGIAHWRVSPSPIDQMKNVEGWWTLTGEEYPGRPIEWEVTHWMPLPSPPPVGEEG